MDRAGVEPAEDEEIDEGVPLTPEEEQKLDVFREFVETLDLEDLGEDDPDK